MPVDLEPELQARRDLLLDLLLGAEDVRVVLDEVAHPQESVEGAAGLAPMAGDPARRSGYGRSR